MAEYSGVTMQEYDNAKARVDAMSEAFEKVSGVIKALTESLEAFEEIRDTVAELDEYQSSGQWLKDYEADEAGDLPGDVRRSVLSQDGLYDLLQDYDALCKRLEPRSAVDGGEEGRIDAAEAECVEPD